MIRIGTRGSTLARWQSDWVAARLNEHGIDVKIIVIETSGDRIQDQSIVNIGAQGVFTKEIQRALLRGDIDLAVHSLKDLPTETVDGLELGAVPKRGPHRDAFLSRIAAGFNDLPDGARIGTGSLRRQTQIINRYGNRFQVEEIRGNVETRLRKLDNGDFDALILAEAGLVRLGQADRIRTFLSPPDFLPAVGQGALGLEIRSDDRATADCVAIISDTESLAAVLAERAFLQTLQGGCIAPIAALAEVRPTAASPVKSSAMLTLRGRILSLDGRMKFDGCRSMPFDDSLQEDTDEFGKKSAKKVAPMLGKALAAQLIEQGAATILEAIRSHRG